MSYFGYLQITNRLGWTKTVDIEKSLCLIGSSPSNDVVLNEQFGGGVFPVHLQLICPKSSRGQYRLINLSNEAINVYDGSLITKAAILPRVPQAIQAKDILQLGDFSLQFFFQKERGISIERRTENIGVKLEMLGAQLKPETFLSGRLTLTNLGEEKRCQFVIELEGLPAKCYQIAPAPLLYPGATEELTFKLFHRGTQPPAGPQEILLFASAAGTYPTEMITMPLTLDVLPVQRYSLSIHDDENALPDEIETPAPGRPLPIPADEITEMEEPPHREQIAGQELSDGSNIEEVSDVDVRVPVPEPVIPIESVIDEEPEADQIVGTEVSSDETHAAEPEPVLSVVSQEPGEPAETEIEPEEEESWWGDEEDADTAQTKAKPLNDIRRDIKSRLAGKDIQVIKAGSEVEETEEGSSSLNETTRDA